MRTEINARKIDEAGRNALFVNQHNIKEAVVHFRFWREVHAATRKCSIRDDNPKKEVTCDTLSIDFNGHELLTAPGYGGNRRDAKPQKSSHPFVMRLETLDDHCWNPLRTFIQKELFIVFAKIVYKRRPT